MELPSNRGSQRVKSMMSSEKTITGTAITMCILSTVFYYYEYFLRVAPSVMSAELKQNFLLSEAAFGHLAACYYYAYTPMQIPVGIMMDKFGPRRILTFACLLCAFGTWFFATTSHILLAQIGRFLVGFGSAYAYVGVLKISNVWLPARYFALMAGLCTALGMLGGISGEIVMSYLGEVVGWRTTLLYSAYTGVALTAILWIILRDGKGSDKDEKIWLEKKNPQKLSNNAIKLEGLKEMIKSPQIWICGAIGCLTFLPISGFAEVWAVSFLQTAGMNKTEAAFGSSMIFLGFAIGGPIWGLLSDYIRSRKKILILGSFIASCFMSLVIFCPTTSHFWMYNLLFFSAFFSSAQILIFAVSNDISRPSVSATAIAFTNMVVMVGGVLLPPLIGKMLDNALLIVQNIPVISIQDFSKALAILPISLFVAGILSCALKESYQRDH